MICLICTLIFVILEFKIVWLLFGTTISDTKKASRVLQKNLRVKQSTKSTLYVFVVRIEEKKGCDYVQKVFTIQIYTCRSNNQLKP